MILTMRCLNSSQVFFLLKNTNVVSIAGVLEPPTRIRTSNLWYIISGKVRMPKPIFS